MTRSSYFLTVTLLSGAVFASADGYFEVKDMPGADAELVPAGEPARSTAVSPMSGARTPVGTRGDGYRGYHRRTDQRIEIPTEYQLTASRRHQVVKEIGSGPVELPLLPGRGACSRAPLRLRSRQ